MDMDKVELRIIVSPDNFTPRRRTAEEQLLVAVLVRAFRDLFNTEQHIRRDAINYLTSSTEKEWSFVWCCRHLDLNPNKVIPVVLAHQKKIEGTGYKSMLKEV